MSRQKSIDREPQGGFGDGPATATLEAPAPADPQPNGDPVNPAQPARTKKRPRDPNAPRPIFLIAATVRATGALRLMATEVTIGRARKLAPNLASGVGPHEDGPFILRCKLVA
jgi:hypothetical protein